VREGRGLRGSGGRRKGREKVGVLGCVRRKKYVKTV
jgi:hypothetical protein